MADQSFPWFPGDYIRDTRGLTLAQHGAYFLLLTELYVTGQPLPANAKELHRICSAHGAAERAATDHVVKRYFERAEGGLIQKRAMEEIEKRQNISEKRSKAGKQRHSKSSANAKQTDIPDLVPSLLDLDSSLSLEDSSLGVSVKNLQGKTAAALAFDAYAVAYQARYGAEPVANAKVRGQFSQLVKALGAEEAPQVAAFYVTHNLPYYVSRGHEPGPLLADSGKLRMEWVTGRRIAPSRKLSAVEAVVEKAREDASKSGLIPQLAGEKRA